MPAPRVRHGHTIDEFYAHATTMIDTRHAATPSHSVAVYCRRETPSIADCRASFFSMRASYGAQMRACKMAMRRVDMRTAYAMFSMVQYAFMRAQQRALQRCGSYKIARCGSIRRAAQNKKSVCYGRKRQCMHAERARIQRALIFAVTDGNLLP